MLARIATLGLLLSGYGSGQSIGKGTPVPTFTFTPAHGGNAIKGGKFSTGATIPFVDQFEGTVSQIDLSTVKRIVLTPGSSAENSKCGKASKAVITFTDGKREHGCFAPGPMMFMGDAAVPSVINLIGKFERDK